MRPFGAAIPRPIREGKAPKFKLISLKEHQIWENQLHELNTYLNLLNIRLIASYLMAGETSYPGAGDIVGNMGVFSCFPA